jgi:formylglycine-generating enzyme required for sulfatase activity
MRAATLVACGALLCALLCPWPWEQSGTMFSIVSEHWALRAQSPLVMSRPRTNKRHSPASSASPEYVLIPASCATVGRGRRADEIKRQVCVSAFYMRKYEVSALEYQRCMTSAACHSALGYDADALAQVGCSLNNASRSRHPINCVDWSSARNYCRWEKGRLPTEAEWDIALGVSAASPYPWGKQHPTCQHAIMATDPVLGPVSRPAWMSVALYKRYPILTSRSVGCGRQSSWPVGSRPLDRSRFGVYDMVGNVSEWTEDCHDFGSGWNGVSSLNPVNRAVGCPVRVV